jgi:nucleoside-diphosphate-sugar epimerase
MLTLVTYSRILKVTAGNIMNKIVILGAAGATGQAIGKELIERGIAPRLVGRREQAIRGAYPNSSAEIVVADLETGEGARRAMAGMEVAIMTLGLPYDQFGRYPALMRNIVEAAQQAGVKRFVLVTNIYPYGRPQSNLVEETHPRNPHTFKGRMRLEQEQILEASGLQWLILRLPDFFGPEAELSHARLIMEAALAGKTADVFEPANTPHQFVYTPDVGPIVADLLEQDRGWNEVYHFAGSGLTTVEEFAQHVFRLAGQPVKLRVAHSWMVWLMGIFSPIMKEFVEMMYLHETPVNVSDAKLEALLGPLQRTSYEEGIQKSLARMSAKPFAPMSQ